MKSDKHQQKSPPDSDRSKQKTLHFQPVDKTDAEKEKESKKVQQTLDKTVLSDDVTKSEIMWALEVHRSTFFCTLTAHMRINLLFLLQCSMTVRLPGISS